MNGRRATFDDPGGPAARWDDTRQGLARPLPFDREPVAPAALGLSDFGRRVPIGSAVEATIEILARDVARRRALAGV